MLKIILAILASKNARKLNSFMHATGSGPSIGPSLNHTHGDPRAQLFKHRGKFVNILPGKGGDVMEAIKNFQFSVKGAIPTGWGKSLE